MAIDLAGNSGDTIKAAEAGTIVDKDPFLTSDQNNALGFKQGLDQQTADDIWQIVKQNNLADGTWAVVVRSATGSDSKYNLGPNREISHGQVNVAYKKDANGNLLNPFQYDQDELITAYCHVEPQADGVTPKNPLRILVKGSSVDISDDIALVGRWYAPYNTNTFLAEPDLLLTRGYFYLTGAQLAIVRVTFDANGVPVIGDTVTTIDGEKSVAFPSITGTHTHFEVRRKSKVEGNMDLDGDGVIRRDGQQNPHDWLKLDFGKTQ